MIDHLQQYLGPPTELFELPSDPLRRSAIRKLEIAYFAPSGATGHVVFATSGACRYRMSNGRRVEAMMLLRKAPTGEAFDAVRDLLATFVLLPEANGRSLRHGDAIRADLSKFSAMDVLMVMPPLPLPARYHRAKLKVGKQSAQIDLLWLVPLFTGEAQYALRFGPTAMMMLAAAQQLDLTDMDRREAESGPRDVGKGSFSVKVDQQGEVRVSRRRR